MKRRRKAHKFSVASRLQGIAALQILLCALLFAFMAVDQTYNAYRDYQQNTAQASALFSTLADGWLDSALEASKYAGQLLDNATEQTFIAKALVQGDIQGNYEFGRELYKHGKSLMEQQQQLSRVGVLDLGGNGVYVSRKGSSYYLMKSAADAPYIAQVKARRGGAVIYPPEEVAQAGLPLLFDGSVVVARAVFNPLKLRSQGIYVLSIPLSMFEEIFSAFRVMPEQEYALIYQGKPLLGSLEQSAQDDELPLRELATGFRYRDGELFLYSSYRFAHDGVLTIRAPFSAVFTLFRVNYLLLLAVLLMLCLFVLLIRSLIHGILRPLRHLTSALDETTGAFFPTVTEDDLPRDLEPLFTAYNRMSERIDRLVNEGLRKDVAKREMELQLLRTQINPHYLYNTLECIHMRAYINHDYEVASMAELLGSNLQYGLRNTNARVMLSEEFEKAGEYVTLVSHHYGESVSVHFNLDESVRDCLTIKLLLQPLIENAIQHGRRPESTLRIDVLGYPDGEDAVCLQVSDDGEGMTQEALHALLRRLEEDTGKDAIGLRNVHRRLRLRYGEGYGVSVRSVPQECTVVTLRLPRQIRES